MATHAKKKFVVDPSEARYTGEQRRAFGSVLHEVEFWAGDRRGEKIWVSQAPTAAQTRERMKRKLAERRALREKAVSLQDAPANCQPGTVHPEVSAFPQRHRAKDAAPPETLLDVVRRQAAEEEEHERRSLDPNDEYPPEPMGAAIDGLEAVVDAGASRQAARDRQADQEFLQREVARDILALAAEAPEDDEDDYPGRSLDPEDDDLPAPRARRRQRAAGRGAHRDQPAVGTTYTRVFRGREVRCQVVARAAEVAGSPRAFKEGLGFQIGDQVFSSLTAAAEHLTGYPVSGPVFWGLR